jgi:hypothetical protein
MEKDILSKYKMTCRDDVFKFLKSLWNETPQLCPLCNGTYLLPRLDSEV